MAFCSNCGAKLNDGVKFCSECGASVNGTPLTDAVQKQPETPYQEASKQKRSFLGDITNVVASGIKTVSDTAKQAMTTPTTKEQKVAKEQHFVGGHGDKRNDMQIPPTPPTSQAVSQPSSNSARQQEYVGKVYKCPNCGSVVGAMDAICSSCGFYLTDRNVGTSVQRFQEQLGEIENKRYDKHSGGYKRSLKEVIGIGEDEREYDLIRKILQEKIALIKIFPVPNTVDQIVEFILLAVANIDVNESKRTIWNKKGKSDSISEAWIAKMQQVYQKAKMLFPNDPMFGNIQDLYFKKMQELNITVD